MLKIDAEQGWVSADGPNGEQRYRMDSPEAFRLVADAWLRCSWDSKYVYSFTWLGRPVIQLPDDLMRIQEVIYRIKPDVILESGIAHGGSLVFYAGLCRLIGKGRVIGVDVEIRPKNRKAIEEHALSDLITLVEGSSIDPRIVARVTALVGNAESVLVVLDSNHAKEHVLAELRAYAPLVSRGSYIVVADGIMASLAGAPRSAPDWSWNNPKAAAEQFVKEDARYALQYPEPEFNEGANSRGPTYWPDAWLKRIG
jgi:cephalosporin hydroxylase